MAVAKAKDTGPKNDAWRYTTHRDAATTTFKWRWDFEMSDYEHIQNGCTRELMEGLG